MSGKVRYKEPSVGTYVVDRRFPSPIGRIKKSSGMTSERRFTQLLASLQSVYEKGRTEDLLALKNGIVSPVEFLAAFEDGAMRGEDWNLLTLDLSTALHDWLEHADLARTTYVGYKNCIIQLLRQGDAGQNYTVGNLTRLLSDYRYSCAQLETHRSFDQTRAVCLSFARDKAQKKKGSELYSDIRSIPIFGKKAGPKEAKNKPFTPQELDKLLFTADEYVKRYQAWIWFLCLTGMGPKEFVDDGFISGENYIEIFGRKRQSRHRRVPKIYEVPDGKKPSYMTLRRVMKKLGNRTPYDCRRTAIVWWDRAGIDRDHGTFYAGWEMTTTLRGRYKQEDVNRWLTEDAGKLRDWVSHSISNTDLPTATPVVIAKSPDELGSTRQADSMDQIKEELNRVLAGWKEHGFLQNEYRVSTEYDALIKVDDDT